MSEVMVFDLSAHVKVEVAGRDAAHFLHNLSTNDIVNLPPDRGCEAFFCTAKAKVVFHAVIWNLSGAGEPTCWLDAGPGPSERVVKHLDRYLISERVEITDRTSEFVQYRVVGNGAHAAVAGVVNGSVPDTPDMRHAFRALPDGTPCHVFAHDLLRLPSYDLVCPRTAQASLWQAMATAGLPPGDAEQYEVLRIEAGLPEFGKDIDENRFVAGRAASPGPSATRKGVISDRSPWSGPRPRSRQPSRRPETAGDGPATLGPGCSGDREVGLVTSSVRSPQFGPIALGYVWRQPRAGTALRVEDRNATVTALPFA
jgi:glycine cleavage system aminomethyltransferase T